jgi:hypothetical protein
MAETKPKKSKFKYTRELVRIAIADGMTQEEIGALCRAQQSIVSGWAKGKSLALEHQVAELKKRYGHRLNRTTSRVYLTLGEAPSPSRWEDTERAQKLFAARELKEARDPKAESSRHQLQQEIRPPVVGTRRSTVEHLPIDELLKVDQEDFEEARQQQREHLTQVEGPIVLRYTFVAHKLQRHRDEYEFEREPVARWMVHQQPNGKFVLVQQKRRCLEGRSRWEWEKTVFSLSIDKMGDNHHAVDFTHKAMAGHPFIECADDAARWLSSIHGPMDASALLEHSDAYFQNSKTIHGPHDERTLPFLLRKMLVEQGHEVPGLVRISGTE